MYGCIHSIDQLSRPRFFEIEMCNQQDDNSYVTTLLHELTHFEQRLRGKWKQQWKKDKVENKWCSKIVSSDTKYMKTIRNTQSRNSGVTHIDKAIMQRLIIILSMLMLLFGLWLPILLLLR